MKKTLFAVIAAALLALPAACVHPHYGHPGRAGGPGGCPKHQQCGCKQQSECRCPDCACKKGGACTCGPQKNCPQKDCPQKNCPNQPQEQPPAAK